MAERRIEERVGRGLWLVVLLGAAFEALNALLGDGDDRSLLWPLAPLLMAVFVVGLWRRGRGRGTLLVPAGRLRPALLLAGGSWLTGMLYELALPLLFMDERMLWAARPRPISTWRKIAYGVALGLVCWVAFVGWAALVA